MKHFELKTYLDDIYARFPEADGKPVIGITGNYEDLTCKLGQGYYQSVVAAGGVPLVIPPVDSADVIINTLDRIDGAETGTVGDQRDGNVPRVCTAGTGRCFQNQLRLAGVSAKGGGLEAHPPPGPAWTSAHP